MSTKPSSAIVCEDSIWTASISSSSIRRIVVVVDFVALDLVVVVDRLAGVGVDIDALDRVAGLAVEHPERDLFGVA